MSWRPCDSHTRIRLRCRVGRAWFLVAALTGARAASTAGAAVTAPADTGVTFERFLDGFAALAPDPARGAAIPGFTLQRDAAEIRFGPGELFLCSAVADRVCGAVYVGSGTFLLRPPTQVEREQLARTVGADSLEVRFAAAALVFDDSTLAELERLGPFGARAPPAAAAAVAGECVRYLFGTEKKQRDLDPVVAKAVLEAGHDGMFYAHLAPKGGDPVFFGIDSRASEAVSALRRPPDDRVGSDREVVTQFARAEELVLDPDSDVRGSVDEQRYRIEASIADDLDFEAVTTVDLLAVVEGERWLPFLLAGDLEVDSVRVDGEPASWFKGEKSSRVWVRLNRPSAKGAPLTIRFRYHGRLLERTGDWITLLESVGWYPRHVPKARALFDLTFRVPSQFQFACVGRPRGSRRDGRFTTSRWVTDRPVRNASFALGFFKEFEVKDARIPPLRVQMAASGHTELASALGQEGITSGRAMDQQVAADAANSLAFFAQIYGPPPDSALVVTETAERHGEAFPGLIRLAWTTFQDTRASGSDEMFRAHEVAHQWWGLGLDFKTYHDQWLSEAAAEYSALWYLQAVRGDNRRFFATLKDWREEVLSNRQYLLGRGPKTGPVWLGVRNSTSTTRGDYGLVVYRKGAWVLHMLRNLLLDLDTMSDARFTGLMRDFYRTYAGRAASTTDFQFLAEAHVGQGLSWFFDQWVYGTGVPTYDFAWTSEPAGEGRFLVRCRVEQTGVPPSFRMYVPVKVEFAGGRFARTRVLVEGARSEFTLPVPLAPQEVVFNDLSSVLCEVRSVPW
jgi:hypothetical protein